MVFLVILMAMVVLWEAMVGYHTLSQQVMKEPLHLLSDLLLLSHTLGTGIPCHMAMLAMDSSLALLTLALFILAMATLAMLTLAWAMLLLLLLLRMNETMLCYIVPLIFYSIIEIYSLAKK